MAHKDYLYPGKYSCTYYLYEVICEDSKGCSLCCVFSVLPLSSSLCSMNLEGSKEGSIGIKDKGEEKQGRPIA